jgi:hypothetical protein
VSVKRVIVFSSLITSGVWVALTALSIIVLFPVIVDAQAARIVADEVVVGPANGAVVRLLPPGGPGEPHGVAVIGANGQVRGQLNTGGAPAGQPPNPTNAGLNIYAEDGTVIGRLGTAGAMGAQIYLSDRQGKQRFVTTLDDGGNPSIQLLDADGNVIWSAP